MDKARKSLKDYSMILLFFAALSLVRMVFQYLTLDLTTMVKLSDGVTLETMKLAKYIVMGLFLVLLIPQVFVGMRGLRIAANPDSSKTHIVWAIILTVFTVMGLAGVAADFVEYGYDTQRLLELLDCAVDLLALVYFVYYAKKVQRLAQ